MYKSFVFPQISMWELPCTSVHSVKLQGNILLALASVCSPHVKRAASAYPNPTSLSGNSDGQTLVVALLLLYKVQESAMREFSPSISDQAKAAQYSKVIIKGTYTDTLFKTNSPSSAYR